MYSAHLQVQREFHIIFFTFIQNIVYMPFYARGGDAFTCEVI
jgi:hypothetical protein